MCQGPCHPGKQGHELVSNSGLWSQIASVLGPAVRKSHVQWSVYFTTLLNVHTQT